jgi:hypothetical protein
MDAGDAGEFCAYGVVLRVKAKEVVTNPPFGLPLPPTCVIMILLTVGEHLGRSCDGLVGGGSRRQDESKEEGYLARMA